MDSAILASEGSSGIRKNRRDNVASFAADTVQRLDWSRESAADKVSIEWWHHGLCTYYFQALCPRGRMENRGRRERHANTNDEGAHSDRNFGHKASLRRHVEVSAHYQR